MRPRVPRSRPLLAALASLASLALAPAAEASPQGLRTRSFLGEEELRLRQRVGEILSTSRRNELQVELFIQDLLALGRPAAKHILDLSDERVDDRHITEVLLRLGGDDVVNWVDRIYHRGRPLVRQMLLVGVPRVALVSPDVRKRLPLFLQDWHPQARALAVQKLYSLVKARQLVSLCRDSSPAVQRAAVKTVSTHWQALQHGSEEIQNLQRLVAALENSQAPREGELGRGFVLALEKESIARTQLGRELKQRTRRLPRYKARGLGLDGRRLAAIISALEQSKLQGPPIQSIAKALSGVLRELTTAEAKHLLSALVDSHDADIRLGACETGLQLLDPALASEFVRYLKDPSPSVRAKARKVLEETRFFTEQQQRWQAHSRRS